MRAEANLAQLVNLVSPGSKLHRTWKMTGGVSADVTALELLRSDGSLEKLIVRQHGERDLQRNQQIARDEFRLLDLLWAAGLAVPEPVGVAPVDQADALILRYVDGTTEFAPADFDAYLTQLATQLARIHQVNITDLAFLPADANVALALRSAPPLDSVHAPWRQDALALISTLLPASKGSSQVLLHGDFWPGNVIWQAGRLAAVIDWEDAALGDPLSDLANARLELLFIGGPGAMQVFTTEYRRHNDVDCSELPLWDLVTALRLAPLIETWGLADATVQQWRNQISWFVTQALAR